MGSQQTSSKIAQINHPKLNGGIITMYKQLIVESSPYGNYTEWLKGLHNLKQQNKIQKAAFFLPTVEQNHQNGLCGIDVKLKLYFQVFPFTLFEQINKRKQHNNEQFTEQQLWFLIYHLTYASYMMQKKKKKCGDIRPRNILINQQGHLGIINTYSFPNQKSNYYKSLTEQQITYLAPEELHDLEDMVPSSRVDLSIAESFSIGLTLLDAALLYDHQQLYCLNPVSFKNQIFNANILQLKKRSLSPFLIRTIINMLEPKAFNRPSPGQTFSIIIPYQKQILNMQQFIPDKQKSKQSLQQFQGKIK